MLAAAGAGKAAAKDLPARPHRRWREWWPLAASLLAISLLGLVALLQLVAPDDGSDGVHSETRPHDDRRLGMDGAAVADAVAVRDYGPPDCLFQPGQNCSIICRNLPSHMLSSKISELLNTKKECANNTILEVSNVEFPNNTLAPGWLDVRANLSTLVLGECDIQAFHDDAFNSLPFANLKELELRHLTLRKLQAAVLRPICNIRSLSVLGCDALQEVDPQLTASLPFLASLQVQNSIDSDNRQVLPAFMGIRRTVATVDLQYNRLGTLRREDLGSAVSVASLYLSSCGIDEVLVGTFPSSSSRQQLYLSENNLTTLPNMSISFENQHAYFGLYLKGNPWHCDCSLLWLLPHVSTIRDMPVCSTPQDYSTLNLTDALELLNESCYSTSTEIPPSTSPEATESSSIETSEPTGTSEGTTSEDSTTTSDVSTKTPTTEPTSPTAPNNTSSLPPTTPESTSETTSSTNSETLSPTVTTEKSPTSTPPHERPDDLKLCYHVDSLEDDTMEDWSNDAVHISDVDEFTLKISVPYSAAGGFLVWKGTDSPDCYESSPLTSPVVVLENLKPQVDYNICVLRREETRTSIHNCHPHRTMAEYSKQAWISNGDRSFVVSMTALASFVVTVLSVLGAVLLLWRFPNMIFEDVVILDRKRVLRTTRRVSVRPQLHLPPTPPPRHRPTTISQSTDASDSTASTSSYITLPGSRPPSPMEWIAQQLGRPISSIRRMFGKRESAVSPSFSPPSNIAPPAFSRPSIVSSTLSTYTDSTATITSEDQSYTDDIYPTFFGNVHRTL